MAYTLNEKDWQKYFDVVIAGTMKPLFYKTEEPFYIMNTDADTFKG